jgi:hypothetical protein
MAAFCEKDSCLYAFTPRPTIVRGYNSFPRSAWERVIAFRGESCEKSTKPTINILSLSYVSSISHAWQAARGSIEPDRSGPTIFSLHTSIRQCLMRVRGPRARPRITWSTLV